MTLVHILYAHAADDLLILPHAEEEEANLVEQTLTVLHSETHLRSTNLASLVTQAEQQLPLDTPQVIHFTICAFR